MSKNLFNLRIVEGVIQIIPTMFYNLTFRIQNKNKQK